jgi:hypothetical protein
MKKISACFLLLFFTSCWRMPQEGEVSTLPNINNPAVTHQSGSDVLKPGF